jgi:hypothetical protein
METGPRQMGRLSPAFAAFCGLPKLGRETLERRRYVVCFGSRYSIRLFNADRFKRSCRPPRPICFDWKNHSRRPLGGEAISMNEMSPSSSDDTCTLSEAATILGITEGAVVALAAAPELTVFGQRPKRFRLTNVRLLRERLADSSVGVYAGL